MLVILCIIITNVRGQDKGIRNVIVMIPDGTSSSLLSIARWYQCYTQPDRTRLSIDPYWCGAVKTHSSDAPIGDSAPTTSCYMTGQPSQTGFVSTYPVATTHDLVPIEASRAYQPLATLLEVARVEQGKAAGLVFTCEFPHATPADCAAHSYNRGDYRSISKQMVYNKIDVLIGGGEHYLKPEYEQYLHENGYEVIKSDIGRFRQTRARKLWALFAPESMPYDIDRDTATYPSLAEMTRVALQSLSTHSKGFFLMVEGSKIDWAAHDNDAKTMITEFLAFDDACKEALAFARQDGHTLVVILPDHGNSGISLGNRDAGYDRLSLDTLMRPLTRQQVSAARAANLLQQAPLENMDSLLRYALGLTPTTGDYQAILSHSEYTPSPLPKAQRISPTSLTRTLTGMMNNQRFLGFTTHGHTGEDVFLAAYHPNGKLPIGMNTNIDIHRYIAEQMRLKTPVSRWTDSLYMPHTRLCQDYTLVKDKDARVSHVKFTARGHEIIAEINTNEVVIDGKKIKLNAVVVYSAPNQTFYISSEIRKYLK